MQVLVRPVSWISHAARALRRRGPRRWRVLRDGRVVGWVREVRLVKRTSAVVVATPGPQDCFTFVDVAVQDPSFLAWLSSYDAVDLRLELLDEQGRVVLAYRVHGARVVAEEPELLVAWTSWEHDLSVSEPTDPSPP